MYLKTPLLINELPFFGVGNGERFVFSWSTAIQQVIPPNIANKIPLYLSQVRGLNLHSKISAI